MLFGLQVLGFVVLFTTTLSQTHFDNSTRLSIPGKAVTGCAGQCFRNLQSYTTISWSQAIIAETITAATLVLIINNRTNSTRTSTIYNTEIDLGDYVPTTVNSAGTVTTSVVLLDGSTYSTRYIQFPSKAYLDYPSTYSLCGTVATTIDGVATCLTYQTGCDVAHGTTEINRNAPTFTLPSHPPLLKSLTIDKRIDLVQDPKGWTYSAVLELTCADTEVLRPLFPDLGLWSCNDRPSCVAPARAITTALILTSTSTSIEMDAPTSIATKHASSSPSAAVSSRPTIAPQTTSASFVAVQKSSDSALPINPTMAHSSEESLLNVSPTTVNGALSPTVPPAPLIPEPLGSSSASKSTQSKVLPLEDTRVRDTNAVKTMPVASNSQVSQTGAETSATSEQSILAPVTSIKGESALATSASFEAESEILLPTVLVPVKSTFVNAQGATFVSTGLTAAGYLPIATTDVKGNAEGSQILAASLLQSADSTPALPAITAAPAFTIGNQIITANSLGQYIIGSRTLTAGGAFSISGTPVSLAPNTAYAIVGSSTYNLAVTGLPALTLGSQTISPNPNGQYMIGSQTLNPGGRITVSGTQISLAANTAYVVVGSSTQDLAVTSPPALTLTGQTITPDAQGRYTIGSQVLTPGGAITVSGTRISLAQNIAYAVLGSSTEHFATNSPPTLTVGSQTITLDAQGRYIIGSQTLTPGGVINVSNTQLSLASDGTDVVIGTSTEALGPYIIGGLGPSGVGNGTNPQVFTGGASGRQRGLWIEAAVMFIGIWVVMLL